LNQLKHLNVNKRFITKKLQVSRSRKKRAITRGFQISKIRLHAFFLMIWRWDPAQNVAKVETCEWLLPWNARDEVVFFLTRNCFCSRKPTISRTTTNWWFRWLVLLSKQSYSYFSLTWIKSIDQEVLHQLLLPHLKFLWERLLYLPIGLPIVLQGKKNSTEFFGLLNNNWPVSSPDLSPLGFCKRLRWPTWGKISHYFMSAASTSFDKRLCTVIQE
jgi:hypothetical protein